MLTTTLNEIRGCHPCKISWTILLGSLGKTRTSADNEVLTFKYILKTLGIEDAIWCLRTKKYKEYCLFNADIAESVLHFQNNVYLNDKQPRNAIDAIRAYHSGKIDLETLADAANAAFYTRGRGAFYAARAATSEAAHVAFYATEANQWAVIEQLFTKHFCGEQL